MNQNNNTKFNINRCNLDTIYGRFDFFCYNWGLHEDENILVLKTKHEGVTPPYVRIQSACFTSEIFRNLDCDCHEQLEQSLKKIQANWGYFIYLLRDGRGAGIFSKTKVYSMYQNDGIDTADAYDKLKIPRDPRNYDKVAEVLSDLNINNILLLTNNPRKIDSLVNKGFLVTRESLLITPTEKSLPYLKTKKKKLNHLMDHLD